jgi:hypothetical protein
MGERVFIGPESREHPVLRVYVQYYSTAVQRLFCMSRYYLEGIPKSSVRPVLLACVLFTTHKVRRTIC